jgi:hypothetical protein
MKKRGIEKIENGLGRDLMIRKEVGMMIEIGIEGVKEVVRGIEGVKEVVRGIEVAREVETTKIGVVREVEMIKTKSVEVVIEVEMTKKELVEVMRGLKKIVEKEVEMIEVEMVIEIEIETTIEIVIVIVNDKKHGNYSYIDMQTFYNRMTHFLRL